MLAHRLWRWSNNNPALIQRLLFTGWDTVSARGHYKVKSATGYTFAVILKVFIRVNQVFYFYFHLISCWRPCTPFHLTQLWINADPASVTLNQYYASVVSAYPVCWVGELHILRWGGGGCMAHFVLTWHSMTYVCHVTPYDTLSTEKLPIPPVTP